MKFYYKSLVVLAVVSARAMAAQDGVVDEEAGLENDPPTFLRNGSKEGYSSAALNSLATKVPAEIGSLEVKERAELVGTLAEEIQKAAIDLEKVDLSEFPALEHVVKNVKIAADGAKKPLSDAMYYMNRIAAHQEKIKDSKEASANSAGLTTATPSQVIEKQRRTQEKGEKSGADFNSNQSSSSSHPDWRKIYNHHQKKSSTHGHTHSVRHHHAQRIQEALLNGDHNFLNSMMNSMHGRTERFSNRARERRDLQATKNEHCEQLTKCALSMSLYDLFVYYYSDDINTNTGEVDDIVSGFDESLYDSTSAKQGIEKKRDTIQTHGATLWPNFGNGGSFIYDDTTCNLLLEQFHRSIEVNGNPEWEGAFVSQVCLAEGTQAYVKLEEVLKTLANNYRDLASLNDLDAYKAELLDLVEPFATEVLICAEDLFDSLPNPSSEPFPFYGDTAPTDQTMLEEYVFPSAIATGGRDPHGRLTDLSQRAFETTSYGIIRSDFEACLNEGGTAFATCFADGNIGDIFGFIACLNDNNFDPTGTEFEACFDLELFSTSFNSCMVTAQQTTLLECLPGYAEPIQEAIELVFGERASTGFICGIKDAVIIDGKNLPGRCCLNAPFELTGDLWGYEYNCEDLDLTCTDGPVLSGISEEACHVYGGKFCPVADCQELRDCVDSEITYANSTDLPMYKEYLQSSPQIGDNFNDQYTCGRAREYFGFQDTFINDEAICEDIQQLRFSADFDFLNEFFNQGTKGTTSGPSGCDQTPSDSAVECVPVVGLADANRDVSGNPPATDGQAWRSTNFALSKAVGVFFFVLETIDAVKCPCDPFCVSDNVCGAAKTIIGTKLTVLKFALELAFDISAFTYGELAEVGNIEPIETWENTNAIFPNMDLMGTWLQERMRYLYFETTCRSVENLLPGHGCDGMVNLCSTTDSERIPDQCTEDAFAPEIQLTRVNELCSPDKHVFPSVEMARECVEKHVTASDDCYQTAIEVTVEGAGAAQTATCGNITRIAIVATEEPYCHKFKNDVFDVLIDTSAKSYCEFSQSPDIAPALDISEALELCSGKIFFNTVEEAIMCIELYISAKDDCRELELRVTEEGSVPTVGGCSTVVHTINITANVKGCSLSTTEKMMVFVDPNVEHPSCKFDQGPNLNPILDTSQAVELCNDEIFATIGDAEDCVLGNTKAKDAAGNCRPVVLTVDTVNVNGLCEHQVTVTANIKDCDELETVSVPINVTIDNEPPIPTCSFAVGDTVDESGSGVLVDPQLIYSATENCGTNLVVNVEGFSNEKEDFNAQEMLLVYETKAAAVGSNRKVGWYVASTICSTNSNGQCISDPALPDRRFYQARITATDKAGLSQTAECTVEVVQKDKSNPPADPTQFFALMTYTHSEYIPDPAV